MNPNTNNLVSSVEAEGGIFFSSVFSFWSLFFTKWPKHVCWFFRTCFEISVTWFLLHLLCYTCYIFLVQYAATASYVFTYEWTLVGLSMYNYVSASACIPTACAKPCLPLIGHLTAAPGERVIPLLCTMTGYFMKFVQYELP